jgi:mono/diheme cytochrome c family protein
MNPLARFSLSAVLLCAATQVPTAAIAQQPAQQPAAKVAAKAAPEDAGGGSVDRGRYIVENVAMCGRCHTPGGDGGKPDRAQWLQGAPIRQPGPDWAVQAPRIAGRPPGTDAEFVTLLTTGISRTGLPPRPPLPQFHMQKTDAQAVLAYLKSLK